MDFRSKENQLILNPKLKSDELAYFEHAWAYAMSQRKFESHIGLATSGTTSGFGKLVLLEKAAFVESAKAVNEHLQTNSNDIWLKALPKFHVGGLGILARAQLSDSQVVEYAVEKWDVQVFYQNLIDSKATIISLVPTQIFDLLNRNVRAPRHLRAVLIGGAALSPNVYVKALELGWQVLPSYGMTETCSMIACAEVGSPVLKTLSHAKIKLDENNQLEVCAKSLLTAYVLQSNEAYRLVDPKVKDSEGNVWFRTGDSAEVSQNGLKILGRGSDFFKVGGEGVSLAKLENIFAHLRLELNSNDDSVLLVVSDERLGSRVDLLSTARDASQIEKLVRLFNERVVGFERIRQVHQVERIPRTELGKVKRLEALALVQDRDVSARIQS